MLQNHPKPDIFILGVGHSGTSLLAKMLFTLGWEPNDADEAFCESVGLRELNDRLAAGLALETATEEGLAFLAGLRSPFALKDPRLVFTLPLWIKVLLRSKRRPVLLRIVRDTDQVARSYIDRGGVVGGEPSCFGRTLQQLLDSCETQYRHWPFAKLTIEYEKIVAAAALVGQERRMRWEGGLWTTEASSATSPDGFPDAAGPEAGPEADPETHPRTEAAPGPQQARRAGGM